MGAQAPICISVEANPTLALKIISCHALHTPGFIGLLPPQYCSGLLPLWPPMRGQLFQMPVTLRCRSVPPVVSRLICGLISVYPRCIKHKRVAHTALFKTVMCPALNTIYSLRSQNRLQRPALLSKRLHYPLLRGCNCPHGHLQAFPKATG